jgi:hypothetical protein
MGSPTGLAPVNLPNDFTLFLPAAKSAGTANKLSPPVNGAAITAPIVPNILPTTVLPIALKGAANALAKLLKNPILNKLYYDNKYRK